MERIDLTKPGERKKLISAAVLGLVAIIVLWWTFIGFGSKTPTTATRTNPSSTPQRAAAQQNTPPPDGNVTPAVKNLEAFRELKWEPATYNATDAKRNIFAYYEPPAPKPSVGPAQPPSTPTPTPPVLLASVSPANVYARTADFKLEVAGDKFTPAMRIFVDGRELPTAYKNPQQVSATIPASFIAAPGARNVMVRTPDNSLYSNSMSINVAAPPTPNYTYIGIISPTDRVGDVALVQDKNNKDTLNVNRGDVLSGRFRVTSISEKELVLTDTTLKIKHTIAKSEGDRAAGGPLARPTPRVDAEDDEP